MGVAPAGVPAGGVVRTGGEPGEDFGGGFQLFARDALGPAEHGPAGVCVAEFLRPARRNRFSQRQQAQAACGGGGGCEDRRGPGGDARIGEARGAREASEALGVKGRRSASGRPR